MSERTELQRAARNVYNALAELSFYAADLERTSGGEAVGRKVSQEVERAYDLVLNLMHEEDS